MVIVDCNDVVMKYVVIDSLWCLLGKYCVVWIQLMQVGYCFVGFEGLLCWIFYWGDIVVGVLIIDEKLYFLLVIFLVEVVMVGCFFIVEVVMLWQCCMVGKVVWIGECGVKDC